MGELVQVRSRRWIVEEVAQSDKPAESPRVRRPEWTTTTRVHAERSVWVSTYAYFDGPQAFARLAQRLDNLPGLRVTILLNIQRARGDTTAGDQLVRRFTDQFWGKDWPGASKPAVYYDPRSLDPSGPSGVLHAKAVVVDDEAVFVTSANLIEAALDRNIELALIIQVSHTPRYVTPVQPKYWVKPTVHRTGVSLHRTGTGNTDSCIACSGYEYGLPHSSSKPPSMNNRG